MGKKAGTDAQLLTMHELATYLHLDEATVSKLVMAGKIPAIQVDRQWRFKRAAIDDGKNVNDHPNVDVPPDQPGHLHKALELLRKVHGDVAHEEDDPATRGLRDRAVGHIDGAIHATEKAIGDVNAHR